MRRKAEPRVRAAQYWAKAETFAASARALSEAPSVVVAACTAAVNTIDALCVQALGQRNATPNHADALAVLRDVDILGPAEKQRIRKHFQVLLQMRHLAAYTWQPVSDAEARRALQHMERLLEAALPVAKLHGWAP